MRNDKFYERCRLSKKKSKNKLKKEHFFDSYKNDYSLGDLLSDAGNQKVRNFFESGFVQAKLNVGQPGDIYEKEADRIAEEIVKGKSEKIPKISKVQLTSGSNKNKVNNITGSKINSLKGRGNPLDKSVKDYFEPRFGVDLGNVRVHTDNNANLLAKSIYAKAFTYGNDIAFDQGQYQPNTFAGKQLIAHELAHVVQQGGGQNDVVQRQDYEPSGRQIEIFREKIQELGDFVEEDYNRILNDMISHPCLNCEYIFNTLEAQYNAENSTKPMMANPFEKYVACDGEKCTYPHRIFPTENIDGIEYHVFRVDDITPEGFTNNTNFPNCHASALHASNKFLPIPMIAGTIYPEYMFSKTPGDNNLMAYLTPENGYVCITEERPVRYSDLNGLHCGDMLLFRQSDERHEKSEPYEHAAIYLGMYDDRLLAWQQRYEAGPFEVLFVENIGPKFNINEIDVYRCNAR